MAATQPEKPENSLDSHHETLHGTLQHPEVGLVAVVAELAVFFLPWISFLKGAKWAFLIIIGSLLAAFGGSLLSFIRGILTPAG